MSNPHKDTIVETFDALRSEGLEAKNPDQSTAMFRGFKEQINACHLKGFSESDINLLFTEAKKAIEL